MILVEDIPFLYGENGRKRGIIGPKRFQNQLGKFSKVSGPEYNSLCLKSLPPKIASLPVK